MSASRIRVLLIQRKTLIGIAIPNVSVLPNLNEVHILNDKATVERRKQARLRVTQPVTLLVLGTHEVLIEACVLDVSTSGVQVPSPMRLAWDTHVKIEGNDAVMLGTVCHCEAQEGGAYKIGIQLSDPLSSLVELELLNRALIRPGKTDTVESPPESHSKQPTLGIK